MLPSDFPLPNPSEEAWVLTVENPDTQKYGLRLAPSLFYPQATSSQSSPKNANAATQNAAESAEILAGRNGISDGIAVLSLTIFPNPAQDMVSVAVPSSFTGKRVTVRLVDVLGKVILQTETTTDAETMTLPVQNLAAGAYRVEMRSGERAAYGALVKKP